MLQRDLKTIFQVSVIVMGTAIFFNMGTAIFFNMELPEAQAATTILIGRGVLSIVFGTFTIGADISLVEAKSSRLLPQTQLALWGLGLLGVVLATNWLQWFEPTMSLWIFLPIAFTSAARKGFLWLWRQIVSKVRG